MADDLLSSLKVRLGRTNWEDAQSLAEELIAGLDLRLPIHTEGGFVAIQPEGETITPFTARNFPEGQTVFNVVRRNQDEIELLDSEGNTPGTSDAQVQQAGGGSAPGEVISGGPGDTYVVRVFNNGLDNPGFDVTAIQRSIDEDETIPAGTPCDVIQTTDGSYYINVPVWR